MNDSRVWKAMTKNGMSILTVFAGPTEDEAKAVITEQLSRNPSRRGYLAKWIADGELVKATSD